MRPKKMAREKIEALAELSANNAETFFEEGRRELALIQAAYAVAFYKTIDPVKAGHAQERLLQYFRSGT